MKLKYLVFSFLFIAIQSCSSTPESEETEEVETELSQEELALKSSAVISKIMQSSDFNLKLNNGEKWQIDSTAFIKLMKVKHQIYVISGKMEDYNEDSYIQIGTEISEFLGENYGEGQTESDQELNHLIELTDIQCGIMKSGNLQNAQISMVNLSILYEEIPKYFEPIK